MKTAISIPDPIFREVEKAARRLGVSRSEFFTRAAERMIETLRDEVVKASYDAAFATSEPAAEKAFRRKAVRRLLAAVEWDAE